MKPQINNDIIESLFVEVAINKSEFNEETIKMALYLLLKYLLTFLKNKILIKIIHACTKPDVLPVWKTELYLENLVKEIGFIIYPNEEKIIFRNCTDIIHLNNLSVLRFCPIKYKGKK